MPGFTFDNKISLGQVITIATVLITVAMAWQALTSRVDTIAMNDVRQDNRLESMSQTVSVIRDTVNEQSVDLRYIRSFVEDERRAARAAAVNP